MGGTLHMAEQGSWQTNMRPGPNRNPNLCSW